MRERRMILLRHKEIIVTLPYPAAFQPVPNRDGFVDFPDLPGTSSSAEIS